MLDQLSLNQRSFLPSIAADLSPVLAPESWPFGIEWLPASACLVGGSVRDALLGRQGDYLDLDFVLPEGAVETAQAIAQHYKAGFVLLDAERQIARVVFPQGTADFAQQVGPTLETDLRRRDFTVNAIAYNPHRDQLLDPVQGYADLQTRTIRMVSSVNLAEDPLRLLRAYRQAAQLGFSLQPETRAVVRTLAPKLRTIAAERVQSELNYLLRTAKGTPWLTMAWQDGVLQDWFPAATAQSLHWLADCDRLMAQIQEVRPEFALQLGQRIRSGDKKMGTMGTSDPKGAGSSRTWLSLAKLTCLLAADPALAELQLRRLKYSRHEIQAMGTILKALPQFYRDLAGESLDGKSLDGEILDREPLVGEVHREAIDVLTLDNPTLDDPTLDDPTLDNAGNTPIVMADLAVRLSRRELSRREQFLFFQNVGATFPAIGLLVLALGIPMAALDPLIQRFLTPDDPVAHPMPLLTGQQLMTGLGLSPGPQVGQILAEIQLAHAEARIQTAADALQLAKQWLHAKH